MSDPVPYSRTYSFTDYQAGNPAAPLPGVQVDNELENVEQSLDEAIDAIKDVRRSDGKLKNGIVTVDSLDPTVAAGVGSGALASAEAAAASADAASDSAVAAAASATAAAGSATAASGYASDALTSRNEAATERTLAQTARTGAQTARDYANQWATEAEDTLVDDGVNTPGYSAYHWAQVALDAAAGSIADGSVTTPKLADGVLSADTTGRAKMADGFVTSAKIADGTIATADLADGAVTSAKIADGTIATGDIADSAITSAKIADGTIATGDLANGVLSADTPGRGKMADGFVTRQKLAVGALHVVQYAYDEYTDNTNITTVIPYDDTIPQVTEGDEVLSVTITPTSTSSKVIIRGALTGVVGTAAQALCMAVFVNGDANAIFASATVMGGANYQAGIPFEFEHSPGSTSPQTYAVRVGPSSGTARLNGTTTARRFGGASKCTLIAEERVA